MIRHLAILALTAHAALAAVAGTVINRTTGAPQAGATVGLNRLGQNGIELIDQAKSDAQGKFTIEQEIRGPHLLRTAYDGVTYNHMLPPGSPTTGLTIDVYNSSKTPGSATKVTKHMLLFEPTGAEMVVNETAIVVNSGKTAWNSDDGTLRFFLPDGAGGKVKVNATAPGGMPIGAAYNKTSTASVFAIDFPVKPGETRFDLTYTFPYTTGETHEGRIVTKDENTYLIAPSGISLTGDNLRDLGTEPRTQAHIFALDSDRYKIQLTGEAVVNAPETSSDGAPKIVQIMPRVNSQAKLIVALALGILALGFVLLYRASDPKRAK
jgi:hypothetical protein